MKGSMPMSNGRGCEKTGVWCFVGSNCGTTGGLLPARIH